MDPSPSLLARPSIMTSDGLPDTKGCAGHRRHRAVTFSLGVEGGTLVSARGRRRANVYVTDGRIAAISPRQEPCEERIDAGGLLVMPGMVDTHVHLMDPSATDREDFPTGTAAAAIAGVTTIVEHAHGGPVREPNELHVKAAYLSDRS